MEEIFIREAIKIADENNSCYGAVVVKNGKIIAKGANRVEVECDPTQHGEMVAIRNASKLLKGNLHNCELYTTAEPCPMCAAAAAWAGIDHICFGLDICAASKYHKQINMKCEDITTNHFKNIYVEGGILREECENLFKKSEDNLERT